jgi:hypothetical protein
MVRFENENESPMTYFYSHPSHRILKENAGMFRVALPHGRDE